MFRNAKLQQPEFPLDEFKVHVWAYYGQDAHKTKAVHQRTHIICWMTSKINCLELYTFASFFRIVLLFQHYYYYFYLLLLGCLLIMFAWLFMYVLTVYYYYSILTLDIQAFFATMQCILFTTTRCYNELLTQLTCYNRRR